jgi:hypothetical protein
LCREQDISYLSHVTPLSGASNMRSLHSEASAHDRLGPFASAPCLTLTGTAGARPCSRRGSHAIHLPISLPSERFCFPLLQRVTSQRYYEDSDSCSAHPPRRSPHLLRHTFLSFRLQPPRLPGHRLPPRQRDQRVSDFAMHEKARRSSPPNRVRYPTDRQFASGCSPPRLAATQLPSASELWLTPTRTLTVLMWRPHGRTHAGENRHPGILWGRIADARSGFRRAPE